ncbi:MAG: MFS transporter [bacterium]|nr:MFS transporter [bacterium]MCP4968882.1 MFS transporter [bacterium]
MNQSTRPSPARQQGAVLAVLAAAMFVYVIDTTLMNVSISALVEDLDTTVGSVQTAITLYTLTMASFMLTGGKLGDIWGSRRAFQIGLVIYGIGTTITALAPTIGFVMFGWSILEGLGSALIVPAINTLVRGNFEGSKRASAYGTLFGVAAAGAAFGPLIGGWVTTALSWRVAFAVEALIVLAVLLAARFLQDAPAIVPKPKLDLVGAGLSVAGLGVFVFGILQTSTRGWNDPLVISMIAAGIVLIGAFGLWVRNREAADQPALLHPSIFRHRSASAGLPILATQTFAQAGLLFLIPLFTQSVLGFDALETGLTLLPLSIGVLATSTLTPSLGQKIYPKYIIQAGLVLLFIGGFILATSLEGAAEGSDMALGLLVGGAAIGLIAGQLPNLILSGVDADEASEASGLQGTSQNLGMALGTAVIGTVILTVGLSSISDRVGESDAIPDPLRVEIETALAGGLDAADVDRVDQAIAATPADVQAEIQTIYRDATLDGFQGAILAGGMVALFGAVLAFWLPKKKLESESVEETLQQTVRNPTIPALQLEMDDLAESKRA